MPSVRLPSPVHVQAGAWAVRADGRRIAHLVRWALRELVSHPARGVARATSTAPSAPMGPTVVVGVSKADQALWDAAATAAAPLTTLSVGALVRGLIVWRLAREVRSASV